MKKLGIQGAMDVLLIPLIVVTVLFVVAGSFGIWAYMGRQDYKTNVDQKIEEASELVKKQTEAAKDSEFAEKEKLPLKDYQAPAAFGAVKISYPKTWSAYVSEQANGNSGIPVDGFFQPVFVPSTQRNAPYALRVQVLSTSYTNEVKKYDGQLKQGKLKASPYIPPKVQTVTGLRLDGEVSTGKQGSMIILPMRDKTLKIWTESSEYVKDLNTNILPNFTFEP